MSARNVYPLYQSTPKASEIVARRSHANLTACTENKKLEHASSSSISSSRQVKDNATGNIQPDRRKLCFVCSGLVAARIKCVQELARICDARYVTQFEQDVTHVIVEGDEENNGANKTLKYLQGIAHRKWVVIYKWVVDSLKEKKLVMEEPYEAVDSSTLEAGPRNSRLREKDLFEGFAFLCIGPYDDVSVEQYKDLLLSTGATVVDSIEALAAERKKLKAIVIQADIHDSEIIGWYRRTRAVPIVPEWVVQCISQYKLISLYPYLQELSQQDVLALGYPEFLVEEEPDEDSDSMCGVST